MPETRPVAEALTQRLRRERIVCVRAGSGVRNFHGLIQAAAGRGLVGLHHCAGIPSTEGEVIWQNLHFLSPSPGRERTVLIEEAVGSAEILTREGEVPPMDRDYFRVGCDDQPVPHNPPHSSSLTSESERASMRWSSAVPSA